MSLLNKDKEGLHVPEAPSLYDAATIDETFNVMRWYMGYPTVTRLVVPRVLYQEMQIKPRAVPESTSGMRHRLCPISARISSWLFLMTSSLRSVPALWLMSIWLLNKNAIILFISLTCPKKIFLIQFLSLVIVLWEIDTAALLEGVKYSVGHHRI